MYNTIYKYLFEQSSALLVVIDAGFTIVAASDAYLNATNTIRENIVSKDIFDVFPDNPNDLNADGANKIRASFNRVLKNKTSDALDVLKYDIPKPESEGGGFEVRYWKLVHSPVFDGYNKVKYIVQTAEDVTRNEALILANTELKTQNEHLKEAHEYSEALITAIKAQLEAEKKALQMIEDSEKRYNMMVMKSPFAFSVMKGKDMVITLANDLMKDFWGKGKQVEEKTLLEVLPELKDQPFPDMINKVYTTGVPVYANEILARLPHKGKMESRYFNIVYQPYFEADETISGVTTIAYEVTDLALNRKKAEENEHRYRMLVEETPVATALFLGPEIRIQYANDIMLGYWGKDKTIIGKPLIEGLPELIGQPFLSYFNDVYTTGKTYTGVEEKADLLINGRLQSFYFNFTYKALRDKQGNIYGVHETASDVTSEVLAKKALEESEARYRNLVYSSPSAIGILQGADLIVTIANEAIIEILGKGKDIIGKPYFDLMPELVEQGYKEVFHEVYTTGKPFSAIETPVNILREEKMERRYYNFILQAQRNLHGEINGVGIIASEVTSQAEFNIQLKTREERFRLLVMQAPVAICVLRGEDYIIETINERMVEMWGRKMEEVVNKPVFDALAEARDQGFKELLDNVYGTGERFVATELPIIFNRNGRVENAFIEFVYEPFRESDGTITGIMVLAHEITDQVIARKKIEESERRLRLLTNSMPQKISNADAEGNVIFFNQQWLDDTGFTFEELKGWGWEKVMHPDDLELTKTNWTQSVNTGNVFDMECRILNKEGEYKWHLSRALPIKDENGKISMWVGSNTDIHGQKEQEAALEKAVRERTKELEYANKELVFQNEEIEKQASNLMSANIELQAFAYVSSHDLKEPLRKIQTFTGRLLKKENENLSDQGKEDFMRIQSSAGRMQQLIEDLLTYSRTSIAERKFEKTNLNIILEEVKTELIEIIEEKQAIIEAVELGSCNVIVFQFRQLIYNLLSNALKFSQPDLPSHIIIKSNLVKGTEVNNEKLSPEKNYCHITFKDNGVGFEPYYCERIFEVFQKLHSKEVYAGTGIGLAIVKKIVENHNGVITATGELNKGAIFDIYIPAT